MAASLFLVTTLKFCSFVLLIFALLSTCTVSGYHQISVAFENTTLQFLPNSVVDKSLISKPESEFRFERLLIHGFTRVKHLKKFPNSLRIKVSLVHPRGRQSNVEVCFHRNTTLGVGMCSQGQWEKLNKGLWVKSMSPFDKKIIDVRTSSSNDDLLQVSVDDEVYAYRVAFLVLGIILLTVANTLSKSLVFYYGGSMTIGVLLVVLIIIFQGMRLLPTGRKYSLAILLYSSIAGIGTFFLWDVPSMLKALLIEIGVGEDMYTPLVVFLFVFLAIAGAWLGFWIVRKIILTEDGNIDNTVSQFVLWSIRLIASAMIYQCCLDHLVAAEALLGGILLSTVLSKSHPLKFVRRMCRRLRRLRKHKQRKFHGTYSSPVQELHSSKSALDFRGYTDESAKQLLDSEQFYSSFHNTRERRKFSMDEWNRFTKESTNRALQELVSSPDFGKWAVANAYRLTLEPDKEASRVS